MPVIIEIATGDPGEEIVEYRVSPVRDDFGVDERVIVRAYRRDGRGVVGAVGPWAPFVVPEGVEK